ncbi:hypothetical protein BESB_064940 [Besnoitia besnoiti]|uniref:Uncharacterized protein n=1 Tax=Besnoitia besnoiti TaxID=94643 RepID=A0A2A9MFN6_BESBE|nr:hypothetical protein BESB_064940 [Besnoitia besnoiti]PFH34463.1 hypothetical protein BESB_064940 [Besnoitia besnoiti]
MLAFVAVYIHRTQLLALVDTGSEATLISPFLAELLNLPINWAFTGEASHHTSSRSGCLSTSPEATLWPPSSSIAAQSGRQQVRVSLSPQSSRSSSLVHGSCSRHHKDEETPQNCGSRIIGRVENLCVTFPVVPVELEAKQTEAADKASKRLLRGSRCDLGAGRQDRSASCGAAPGESKRRAADEHANEEDGQERRASAKSCLLPVVCDAVVLASQSADQRPGLSPSSPFSFVLGLDALLALGAVVDFPRRRLLLGDGQFAAPLFVGPPSAFGAFLREGRRAFGGDPVAPARTCSDEKEDGRIPPTRQLE